MLVMGQKEEEDRKRKNKRGRKRGTRVRETKEVVYSREKEKRNKEEA